MFKKKKKEYPKQIFLTTEYQFKKYISDPKKIVMRSSWEEEFFLLLMKRKDVIQVGSENVVIPYQTFDNKPHRYYMDFFFKVREKTGKIVDYIVEIKPFKETQVPKKGKNLITYKKQTETYLKNIRKWEAAINWAFQYGYKFRLLTDNPFKRNRYKLWHWEDSQLRLPLNILNIRK